MRLSTMVVFEYAIVTIAVGTQNCRWHKKGTTKNDEESHAIHQDLERIGAGNDLPKCSVGAEHLRLEEQIRLQVGVQDRADHGGQNEKGNRWR